MEAGFWHQKWERRDIGFHESQANPLLASHFEKLHLVAGGRVFLPFCGKTRDIAWLLGRGYRVVGVELSQLAVEELFNELGLAPEIVALADVVRYSAKNVVVFVGDFFSMSANRLGHVDAIYDRAALVALPAHTRQKYVDHMLRLTGAVPQLLISYEYDQSLMEGPPFSVCGNDLATLFGSTYRLKSIERKNIEGGLKGKVAATETAWLLQRAG